MRTLRSTLAPLLVLTGAAGVVLASPRALVVCAPGYPGTTAQAQPTMDALAAAAASAAGWKEGSLVAVYHEKEAAGLARLRETDAALALVPLPFFVEHRAELALAPHLAVVDESGKPETWTLVAPKGKVGSPSDLAGWDLLSIAGYSPRFVREIALSDFGPVPADTRISFAPAVLSALRRAASGEKVAVLLDAAQTAALPGLPFSKDLDALHSSKPIPGTILCTVDNRLKPEEVRALVKGLTGLERREGGGELLHSLRMRRFEPADARAIDALTGAERAGAKDRR